MTTASVRAINRSPAGCAADESSGLFYAAKSGGRQVASTRPDVPLQAKRVERVLADVQVLGGLALQPRRRRTVSGRSPPPPRGSGPRASSPFAHPRQRARRVRAARRPGAACRDGPVTPWIAREQGRQTAPGVVMMSESRYIGGFPQPRCCSVISPVILIRITSPA